MRPVEIPSEAGETYVDSRPVSWAQAARFVKEVGVTGRSWRPLGSPPADYTGALRIAQARIAEDRGQEPVTVLNWYDACAYAAWRGCRLPRVHELYAAESTQGVGGWDSVSAELTATRRLDHGSLVPLAGIDAYRDTADEWTLEGALFQPGVDVNRLGGRHVLRIGGGVGFRCVHSDVLAL
ncbi:MAG: SUMF1/EgtB/PvdO family nonheme iron enzyme [Candidatus Saccharibacteria bacterium]|nr:SUMF1/EgtB/PvdO family nonheme iron enzyme [Microbacteriaceae bacterium]